MRKLVVLFWVLHMGINAMYGQCQEKVLQQPFKECPIYAGTLTYGDIDWCNNGKALIQIYYEDFGGTELNANFWKQSDVCREFSCATIDNNNIIVGNSNLKIQAKYEPGYREGFGNYSYTSAEVVSKKKFEYGAFEIRAKIPPYGYGLWSAFWLYGKNYSTGHDYELDIFEVNDDDVWNDINLWFTTHFWGKPDGPHTDCSSHIKCTQNLTNDYHIYKVIWDPGVILWYIDGQEVRRLSRAWSINGSEACYLQNFNAYVFSETFTQGYQSVILDVMVNQEKSTGMLPTFDIDYLKIWQRFSPGNKIVNNGDIVSELYNVVVGNTVTIKSDVSVSSGDYLKVIAKDEIIIENGFEAQIGSDVEFLIDPTIF